MKTKKIIHPIILFSVVLLFPCCTGAKKTTTKTKYKSVARTETKRETPSPARKGNFDIDGLLYFAKQQLGTPYKYASADPKNGGLDCSGFVYYVFQHFKVPVPRSSRDYMNYGEQVNEHDAQKGDVIVFTGTDATQKTGGHVGIILDKNRDDITFIHGSSGKAKGVTISKLSDAYYSQRFLKIVRVVD
ncbi:MAG: hydrolase [Bacteroidota bacterium]|nr:hydrolase [Bacteroidota bacterium]